MSGAAINATGKYGKGLTTGTSGASTAYVSIPAVDINTEWTIASWFLSPIPTNGWETLCRGTSDHPVLVQNGVDLGTYDNVGSTQFHDSGYNINTLSAGWHHLVAVGNSLDLQTFLLMVLLSVHQTSGLQIILFLLVLIKVETAIWNNR